MPSVTKEQVLEALRRVNDPELHRDLVSLNMIKNVAVCDGLVRVHVELTTPACPLKDQIGKDVHREVGGVVGVKQVEIEWSSQVRAHAALQVHLPGVKNVIAIGAGKGGVGKSTIAVMVAYGLERMGARVGLLDADVYGPSIPKMVGLEGARPNVRGEKIVPIDADGVRVMSTGLLVNSEEALVLRGPMLAGILKQFLGQVDWGELDYLIVDLPPGTGDIPLTLAQSIPMTGAVVVCTPQQVALLDALKALRMYQKLNVPILGIVENMSYFIAPDTGREYDWFGRGGAAAAAEKVGVPFLGEIPINIAIRVSGDAGAPEDLFTRTDERSRAAVESFVRNVAGQVSIRNAQEPTVELTIS
ncbi:MAG: Mrp/NBP35 family ATP-binding protein [Phycisphaerae bacterium]|nr:Mrp/NBP35 family ATP-binding protein [Phycisphaerae bacterium]NUQ45293.1 Mrp/NBP35 family ATP-binding protein [Phycisphaerae bacterium]